MSSESRTVVQGLVWIMMMMLLLKMNMMMMMLLIKMMTPVLGHGSAAQEENSHSVPFLRLVMIIPMIGNDYSYDRQ